MPGPTVEHYRRRMRARFTDPEKSQQRIFESHSQAVAEPLQLDSRS